MICNCQFSKMTTINLPTASHPSHPGPWPTEIIILTWLCLTNERGSEHIITKSTKIWIYSKEGEIIIYFPIKEFCWEGTMFINVLFPSFFHWKTFTCLKEHMYRVGSQQLHIKWIQNEQTHLWLKWLWFCNESAIYIYQERNPSLDNQLIRGTGKCTKVLKLALDRK